ncbi:MAG: hypothetical protein R6U98_06750, partial [Pirellulaceae bacterium]
IGAAAAVHCITVTVTARTIASTLGKASYLGMIAEISVKLGRPLRWDPKTETFPGDAEANGLLSAPMRSPWTLKEDA